MAWMNYDFLCMIERDGEMSKYDTLQGHLDAMVIEKNYKFFRII